ncbi:MAG: hypothetical protein V1703_01010 [Candidatus Altiarchaeota archaeon]
MSTISGIRKQGFDPTVSLFLVLASVLVLIVSALSIGVVAVIVLNGNSGQPAVEPSETSTTTLQSTVESITTTSVQSTIRHEAKTTTMLNLGEPTTTFYECVGVACLDSTTTTLAEVQEEECLNHTYKGFRSCPLSKGKLAWFDRWM